MPELDDSFVGLSGGQIFHEMMLRHGVKHIFGYPGGAILPVFDAIYNSTHFEFVLPKHEQGAGHMAEGYGTSFRKARRCSGHFWTWCYPTLSLPCKMPCPTELP